MMFGVKIPVFLKKRFLHLIKTILIDTCAEAVSQSMVVSLHSAVSEKNNLIRTSFSTSFS